MSQTQTERKEVGRILAALLDRYENGVDVPVVRQTDGRVTITVRLSSHCPICGRNHFDRECPMKG